MKECKWAAQRKQPLASSLELVKRLQHWQEKKQTKLFTELEAKTAAESVECTFQPNPDKPSSPVKPTEIYDRNSEWLKLKQRRDKKAADDKYKEMLKPFPNKKTSTNPLDFLFARKSR